MEIMQILAYKNEEGILINPQFVTEREKLKTVRRMEEQRSKHIEVCKETKEKTDDNILKITMAKQQKYLENLQIEYLIVEVKERQTLKENTDE